MGSENMSCMPKPNDSQIKEVYNSIAEGFYNLRQHPITPEVAKIAGIWKPGKLLDIGCGIGNSTLPFAKKGFDCIGVDISPKMARQAKRYLEKNKANFTLELGSMLNLPLKENSFDYVISVAVLHHLDSEEKRLQALEEIRRILKKQGKLFLTVWHKKTNKNDVYIPWNRKGKTYNRYYHFFKKEELRKLLEKTGFEKIKISEDGRKKKNLCILATDK